MIRQKENDTPKWLAGNLVEAKAAVASLRFWYQEQEKWKDAIAQELGPQSSPEPDPEKNAWAIKLIREGAIRLHLQPKFGADGEEILGFEALCRMEESARLIAPGEFLQHLGATGREELDWAMLEKTLEISRRGELSQSEIRIGVNVNPSTLANPNFSERLRSLADGIGARLENVRIEILESEPRLAAGNIARTIQDCKKMGIGFALDDFCSGHSEPDDLRMFDVEEVKVEWALVNRLNDPQQAPEARRMIRGVVEWAQSRGASVTGEGVANESQFKELAALGVKALQGFLFAEALEPNEALGRLAALRKSKQKAECDQPYSMRPTG